MSICHRNVLHGLFVPITTGIIHFLYADFLKFLRLIGTIIFLVKRSNFCSILNRYKISTSLQVSKQELVSISFWDPYFVTEQAVSSVSKTWNDVTMFVQSVHQSCCKIFYIWVSFLKSFSPSGADTRQTNLIFEAPRFLANLQPRLLSHPVANPLGPTTRFDVGQCPQAISPSIQTG